MWVKKPLVQSPTQPAGYPTADSMHGDNEDEDEDDAF